MKLLILGAGFMQLNAIRKAREKGHTVIVSDYLPDAPGKKIAHYSEMTSTFDIEGNINVARKYGIDGILTTGTDQPVLTVARVAETLGLPAVISSYTALLATNKKFMKAAFRENNINSSRCRLIKRDELDNKSLITDKLNELRFPIVIKPLDSQGQRGVFKLYTMEERLIEYMRQTFTFTRLDEIIAEEFCSGDEITISAWVEDYYPYILLITDRPLLNVEPHLGIPDGHIFPSRYLKSHYTAIRKLAEKTVEKFNIVSGPVYMQMIIAGDHVEVVEVACRIGGGHEDELIPLLTGIDPVDMLIEKSLGNNINTSKLRDYNLQENNRYAMIKFIKARPGRVKEIGDIKVLKKMPGVINADFYNPGLNEVKELVDSTRRIGYILVSGNNEEDLQRKVESAYRRVEVRDESGVNMVY